MSNAAADGGGDDRFAGCRGDRSAGWRTSRSRDARRRHRLPQTVCHRARVLVHGQVTIIFVVYVCLSVCLSVCLFVCAEFFSAVFDPISIKLGRMLYVWV